MISLMDMAIQSQAAQHRKDEADARKRAALLAAVHATLATTAPGLRGFTEVRIEDLMHPHQYVRGALGTVKTEQITFKHILINPMLISRIEFKDRKQHKVQVHERTEKTSPHSNTHSTVLYHEVISVLETHAVAVVHLVDGTVLEGVFSDVKPL